MFNRLLSRIGTLWCGWMHESLTWPAHGEYQCRQCGRRYPVAWETSVAGWAQFIG